MTKPTASCKMFEVTLISLFSLKHSSYRLESTLAAAGISCNFFFPFLFCEDGLVLPVAVADGDVCVCVCVCVCFCHVCFCSWCVSTGLSLKTGTMVLQNHTIAPLFHFQKCVSSCSISTHYTKHVSNPFL